MTIITHIHTLLKNFFIIFEDYNEIRKKVLLSDEIFWQEKARFYKFNDIYYFFPYKDTFVKEAILIVKKDGNKHLASNLAYVSAQIFKEELSELIELKGFNSPVITTVPIFYKKEREKGFNHAKLFAKNFAKHLELPYEDILIKHKETKEQHFLQKEERLKNIKNTFSVRKGISLQGKNIIILDDVSTTGQTLQEIDNCLWKHGAKKIIKISVAH